MLTTLNYLDKSLNEANACVSYRDRRANAGLDTSFYDAIIDTFEETLASILGA